ncbi:YciI family protein [Robertkochia solimangrovi]|uniref:YciI family protein n=1 Tax=Robertkochia solimangrovi TaxID=2213046 RepID=UPI00117C54C7|nr:YciI family protein [Robertkochia solimangrovi]TRZ42244.1 hypothetical protein DMZ48_14545 [Robertkochia solimangrovi]
MKKFLLLLHEDLEQINDLSPKEMEALFHAHMNWANQLAESGNLISGDGLHEKGRLISGKESIVKDGPYVESKEMIGGYYLIQASDLEAATEIAMTCPCHLWGGTTEIRQIMEMEEYE